MNGGQTSTAEPNRRATQAPTSAVAKLLGHDTLRKIRTSQRDGSKGRGIDLEVLLSSVEKLCDVHAVMGAQDRAQDLRVRHEYLVGSIQRYEALVSQQQSAMSGLNDADEYQELGTKEITDEDIFEQEQTIKTLETKKRALEARLAGIAKDLDGVLGQS